MEEQARYDALTPQEQRAIDVLDDPDLHVLWDEHLTMEPGWAPPLFTTLTMSSIGVYHPVLVMPASLREQWEAGLAADGKPPTPVYEGPLPVPRSQW